MNAKWVVAHWTRQAHQRNVIDSDVRYGYGGYMIRWYVCSKQKSQCDAPQNNPGVTKEATRLHGNYRSDFFEIDIVSKRWRDSLRTGKHAPSWGPSINGALMAAKKKVRWAKE